MKKLTLLITLACLIQATATSQSCLPEGITFETQLDIDNFQTNHPNCTEIEGDVTIGKYNLNSDITNLNGLSVLEAVGGYLDIRYNSNLTSLTGLDNLTTIGALFKVLVNNELNNLTGLENLDSIGGDFYLAYNDGLDSLTGINSLVHIGGDFTIRENETLTRLTGIGDLSSVGGGLLIFANNALTDIKGLDGLTSIGDILQIGNPALISLSGLDSLTNIGGCLQINYNNTLTNLSGLENLTYTGGCFEIGHNETLTNLTGINNLISVGGYFRIYFNNVLTSIAQLENLTSIGGELRINTNDNLTGLTGLDNIDANSITDLYIHGNNSLLSCEVKSVCDYLAAPNGSVYITNNATGCNNQEEVEMACDSASSVQELNILQGVSIQPNPFSSTTTIAYELQYPSTIQITIYNHVGKQIEVIRQKQSPGKQQVVWNAEGLPGGVYFCVLKTDPAHAGQTLKMIKLKK